MKKMNCLKIVRKSDPYFSENTSLIVKSNGAIDVYSEDV